MILAHEVIQVGLIEILVPVDWVENRSQAEESHHCQRREHQAVLREKAIFRDDSPVGVAALRDQVTITVDEKVEHEAEDDWVDLEVDSQAKEEASEDVPAVQDKINGHQKQCLDNLVVRTARAHREKHWVEHNGGDEERDSALGVGLPIRSLELELNHVP
eukprot:CAMPEP_0185598386 /NCGR_PEP_ID=MMETSP0434-20130131/81956_1 /TAXON_ID=626734 ORGANISM="Favella taraikaensis, Strain Fe Narragansett Bay" /NCGR_SAMPLE_ID=MMETSP0434 /ASSEMBLY_ACC=CAM_ASM_000379 /LENGTH=159 /DNA_ID=CAMNT_0028227341 /DNA_START=531 /DNA_END=1010 /DNA_ORIENTATION=+